MEYKIMDQRNIAFHSVTTDIPSMNIWE